MAWACACCGLRAAAARGACEVCEAPLAQHNDTLQPVLYAEPLAIVVQAILLVIREQIGAGQQLVIDWRSQGVAGVKQEQLLALAEITGRELTTLEEANRAAAEWLLDGSNEHVPSKFAHMYERYFVETCFDDPEALSYMGILENTGLRAHNRELSERPSERAHKKRVDFARRDLKLLEEMESRCGGTAPAEEAVSVGVLRWCLTIELEGAPFAHHAYALEQMNGVHVMLQMWMTDITPVRCLEDGWNYVARLRAFPSRLSLVEAELRTQRDWGITAPRFVLDKVLGTLKKIEAELTSAPMASSFYTSLQDRVAALDPTLHAVRKADPLPSFAESTFRNEAAYNEWVQGGGIAPAEMMAAAELAIVESVLPAYSSLRRAVEQAVAACEATGSGSHAGYGMLPDGDAYYAWRLKCETSTSLQPEEVHALGHEQVKSILGEMRQVIARLSATGDPSLNPQWSVPRNMRSLGSDKRWLYEDSEAGRTACLEDFRSLVREIEERLDPFFDVRPRQPLQIQRVPPHMEEGSPAAFYMPPALDGSRNGVFYANLGDISAQFKFGMRTLTAHEAVPGHHFQLAIQFEMKDLPYFRKAAEGFNAFIEGWALYTERLAREFGFFETEPDGSEGYDLLGHFGDELMRAARLVVDTGIHAFGWTREQAITYMEEHTILAPSDVITEVERYCVLPGQACSYKVGQLAILRRRSQLQAALEHKFDVRAFHHCLLCNGAIPIEMLPHVTADLMH